jgi:hypothetical protein
VAGFVRKFPPQRNSELLSSGNAGFTPYGAGHGCDQEARAKRADTGRKGNPLPAALTATTDAKLNFGQICQLMDPCRSKRRFFLQAIFG